MLSCVAVCQVCRSLPARPGFLVPWFPGFRGFLASLLSLRLMTSCTGCPDISSLCVLASLPLLLVFLSSYSRQTFLPAGGSWSLVLLACFECPAPCGGGAAPSPAPPPALGCSCLSATTTLPGSRSDSRERESDGSRGTSRRAAASRGTCRHAGTATTASQTEARAQAGWSMERTPYVYMRMKCHAVHVGMSV